MYYQKNDERECRCGILGTVLTVPGVPPTQSQKKKGDKAMVNEKVKTKILRPLTAVLPVGGGTPLSIDFGSLNEYFELASDRYDEAREDYLHTAAEDSALNLRANSTSPAGLCIPARQIKSRSIKSLNFSSSPNLSNSPSLASNSSSVKFKI